MGAELVAKQISAAHGDRVLFSELDLVVSETDVVGLVGANGAGKSTLLRILCGDLAPQSGLVRCHPADANIGYLPQEPERRPGELVRDYLARRTGVAEAQRRLTVMTEALTNGESGAEDGYAAALDTWLALGGADFDDRATQVLGSTAPGISPEQPMTSLSGGQAARVGLASLLLSRYDIFLLDEPTNDLDLEGLEKLEEFVKGLRVGSVVVSHDREFLARTVTQVVELDPVQQEVRVYRGGYQAFLEERAILRRRAREKYEEYAAKVSALQARVQTHRQWMEKGVRNARRKSSDSDKIGKKHRAESSEQQASRIRQIERQIERLEEVKEPRKEWELRMKIAHAPRAGAVVARMRDVVVDRGEFTLGPVNLEISWADRVSIRGANGAGKTTLLSTLLGRTRPTRGEAMLGSGVMVGEVDQARRLFYGEKTLLDAFCAEAGLVPEEARTLLAKYGLGAAHVPRPASSLSPGERTRAALAVLQAKDVNFLILDEPTNHLDLPAIEQLESALSAYTGTLILVTHDRRLAGAVDTNRNWELRNGQLLER
ncbi:ABC-F family ATP-binding cassette domain-containing protein [Saccharomonospora glauca]|uniref:ATPase component of ABC transporters with duplicated ATPase domain n=1 Tax=Saccharomonospora glauca K62 TaxID=928724 RepID=I1CYN9_9PSEU|nr:ABC-F family ATP-binding cassette domain-containing protein [Saccharomonospora glauca]EIE97813.1 ATPase component of ABC transporters with duplicated ATPase domain [Saccharomonospora glauca K62]